MFGMEPHKFALEADFLLKSYINMRKSGFLSELSLQTDHVYQFRYRLLVGLLEHGIHMDTSIFHGS